MKKFYAAILMLLIFTISSCSFNKNKIIYIHDNSFKSLVEENFKNNIKDLSSFDYDEVIIEKEEGLLEYFTNLKKSDKNTIFILSEKFDGFDISPYTDKYMYLNDKESENTHTLVVDQSKINYMLGLISGLLTNNHSIAILYEEGFKDLEISMLSFMEGVKKVNPRAFDALYNKENILSINSIGDSDINNFIGNIGSDILFNLSTTDITNDQKIILSNNMKDENFINIFYNYENVINELQNSNFADYVMDITSDVDINLTNFPEEVLNLVKEYMSY